VEAVDFTDADALARLLERTRPGHIFHLSAALTAPDLSSMVRANVLHASALLDAVRRSGIDTRVLIVGSAAEYGPLRTDEMPASEDLPSRPVTPYGCTKAAQTQLAIASGLPVVVARPSNIIGPGMPRELALGRFAAELADLASQEGDRVLRLGDLSAVRDMIDVEDVVRLYWRLLNTDAAVGQVVNVATGTGVSMAEALKGLIDCFGFDVRIVETSDASTRSGGVSVFVASRERLESLVGRQDFIPLKDSLERIAAHERFVGA
jgi:GDP-4-dehydro-6-deoxy-D-mannose reductase